MASMLLSRASFGLIIVCVGGEVLLFISRNYPTSFS